MAAVLAVKKEISVHTGFPRNSAWEVRMRSPSPFLHAVVCVSTIMIALFLASSIAWGQTGACTSGPCVATYHNDPMRDGVNSQETTLTQSLFPTAKKANFGLLVPAAGGATGAVDGLIYAQPLYLSGVTMATSTCSGSQNIVLVATMNNSVYAFTWTYTLTSTGYSFSLTQCWMLNLNQPGEYAIPVSALPTNHGVQCGNTVPQVGILSTPVIDTSVTPPVMYVVTADETVNLTYTYRLHAINVNSGTEVTNGSSAPYDLSGAFHTGLTAIQEQQRPGLALYNPGPGLANIYVAFGSYCDISPYSGYLAGLTYNYSTQSFAPVGTNWVFDTESGSTRQNGGIWMGGAAPAVDSAGNVYLAVANGGWNGTTLFGQSVVKIATTSTGLVPVDYYTPNDYEQLNRDSTTITLCSTYSSGSCPSTNMLTIDAPNGDFDLGAGGVTLINTVGVTSPVCGSNSELVAGGKEGVLYGICYSTQTGSTLENIMGGLDGCGYDCKINSNPTESACTQASPVVPGSIAQCFQGVSAGEDQANGSNEIFFSSGVRGAEAFWAGSAANPLNYLYVAGIFAALEAYQANLTTGSFNLAGNPATFPKTFPYPGTVPALSWNGSTTNTALLWAIDSGGYGMWTPITNSAAAARPSILVVYNPIPVSGENELKELWESSISSTDAGPGAVKFTVPTIAGGLVFVGGGTPGYAPGLPGGTNVNCTAAALVTASMPTICGGQLAVYGELKLP